MVARGCLAVLAGRCVPRLSASCSPSIISLFSGCALILAVLLFFAKTDAPSSATVANAVGANHSAFSLKLALELFRQPKLWFLSLYVIGVSCTYDVFDQQFANFFTSFFATGEQGTRVFGYVTTMGELLNASIMFFAPLIINRGIK